MHHENEIFSETAKGVIVRLRVTPRSARPGLRKEPSYLSVKVRSPAERGKATEEALRALASSLGIARSSLSLASGAASREKRVLIVGYSGADLRKRLSSHLGEMFD